MEQSLASLFSDIRTDMQQVVHHGIVTKNDDTSFEIWISKGSSSLFFGSISLHPDRINIKFSPKLPDKCQLELRQFHFGFGPEYAINPSQITSGTVGRFHSAICNLYSYYSGIDQKR